MSEFVLQVPGTGPLEATYADMPPLVRAAVTEGFAQLAKLSEAEQVMVRDIALNGIEGSANADAAERTLQTSLKLTEDQPKHVVAAGTFLMWLVSSRKESTRTLIESLSAGGLIEPTDIAATVRFADLIATSRGEFRRAVDRSRLGSSVLPSLDDFRVVVDVRLGFGDREGGASDRLDNIELAVPVAVVHIDTDAYNQEIWFQLRRPELERMITDLNTALSQMRIAEKWSTKPRTDD